ncbi:MAG TPA: DUF2934 domain-containing protein [Steroidobacteraceae bacterium]|jgi:hypothetical protein
MHPEDRSIGELAYRLWQARGCPAGTAEQDWLEAEKQLRATRSPRPQSSEALDDSLKGTFPASDPPASRLPDVPPANAAAKWQAAEGARPEGARPETSRAESPRLDTSRVEVSRTDAPRAETSRAQETSRKAAPRRRSQAKSGQSKPRNDSPS